MEATSRISSHRTDDKAENIDYFYRKEGREWHETVHKRGGTVEQNVKDTLDSITEGSEFYLVMVGEKRGGFFVRHQTETGFLVLEGFHVGKEFRTPEFLKQFWDIVKDTFGGTFRTGICSKNEPAIKHLMKQGFEVESKKLINGQIFFILKF